MRTIDTSQGFPETVADFYESFPPSNFPSWLDRIANSCDWLDIDDPNNFLCQIAIQIYDVLREGFGDPECLLQLVPIVLTLVEITMRGVEWEEPA